MNTLSTERKTSYGVPQGSKLGPILFILFTNELLRVFNQGVAFAYADDIAIVVKHKCLKTAISRMQEEFDKVSQWCHDHGLVINAEKTKLMHIRTPQQPQDTINIYFRNDACPDTKKVKQLR